nr:MAG: hypothetical protein [Caudoviricetes sp.]
MLSFKEFISEKLEDIQGKVVDANELSNHLSKTQIKNLMNHPWHKTYAAYPGKPTAYRISSHRDGLGGKSFTVEAGHGQPRNKEIFGDKEDVRHMVSFDFYKNKIGNAHLFRNTGDQRHPEHGNKIWVYHASHKSGE